MLHDKLTPPIDDAFCPECRSALHTVATEGPAAERGSDPPARSHDYGSWLKAKGHLIVAGALVSLLTRPAPLHALLALGGLLWIICADYESMRQARARANSNKHQVLNEESETAAGA